MLNDRNELAHNYDGTLATACAETIVGEYIGVFEEFRLEASTLIDKMRAD